MITVRLTRLLLFVAAVLLAGPLLAAPATVVIDAGHGGRDPGALAPSGLMEKTVTLEAALLLAAELEDVPDVRVVLSRRDDRYLTLAERAELAVDVEADLLVSLHADSLPVRPDLRGASVYTLAHRPTTADAARKARRENTDESGALVAALPIDDEVGAILASLKQTFTTERSIVFANAIVADLKPVTRVLSRPHLAAPFRVLRAPGVPAVLVELGYLSNVDDARHLASRPHLQVITAALARAIERELARDQVAVRTALDGKGP